MGNPLGEGAGGTGLETGTIGANGTEYQGNPAHAEFFQAIPQEYHEAVTPLLQKWDQGVSERFNKVQSDYAPWQEVIGSGNTPQDVVLALNILQSMVNNPRQIYDALNEQYKFSEPTTGMQPPGANGQGQNTEPDLQTAYDQRFQQVESNFQRLAQTQLDYMQAQKEAKEDAALDAELNALRKKHGDFDEPYVLAQMEQLGKSGEEAVQMFQQLMHRASSAAAPKPLLLGQGSGGVPGQQLDPRKMSDQEVKQSAVQMIMAMNQANQQ